MKEIVKQQAAEGQDTKGSAKGKKKEVKEVKGFIICFVIISIMIINRTKDVIVVNDMRCF